MYDYEYYTKQIFTFILTIPIVIHLNISLVYFKIYKYTILPLLVVLLLNNTRHVYETRFYIL